MDSVTALSGSGPAYVYLILEALTDGAVATGLPREQALALATQTIIGSARWVRPGHSCMQDRCLGRLPGHAHVYNLPWHPNPTSTLPFWHMQFNILWYAADF